MKTIMTIFVNMFLFTLCFTVANSEEIVVMGIVLIIGILIIQKSSNEIIGVIVSYLLIGAIILMSYLNIEIVEGVYKRYLHTIFKSENIFIAIAIFIAMRILSKLISSYLSKGAIDDTVEDEKSLLEKLSCDIFQSLDKTTKHNQIKGKRWSSARNILEHNKQQVEKWGEERLFNFATLRYFDVIENELEPVESEVSLKYSMKDLTESVFIVGKMGSGKTFAMMQMIKQIIDKKLAKRIFFHDFKGDFVEKFFRKDKDIILGLQSESAVVFDVWKESSNSMVRIDKFINGLVEYCGGKDDKNKFFNNKAGDYVKECLHEVILCDEFEPNDYKKNWEIFFISYEKLKNDNSKNKDALGTADMAIDVLYTIATRQINSGSSFTVSDFLEKEDIRLFMLNKEDFKQVNGAYFTGIINAILDAKLSERDYNDDEDEHTLFILDEVFHLNFESFKSAATTVRSKQGCLIYGTQKSADKEEDNAAITSSKNISLIFNTQEAKIKKAYAVDTFGKATFKIDEIKHTVNTTGEGGSKTHNTSHKEVEVCSQDQIESIPKNNFITYIGNDNLLFYSKAIAEELENKQFEESINVDINKEYKSKLQFKKRIQKGSNVGADNKLKEKIEDWKVEDEIIVYVIEQLNSIEDEEEIKAVLIAISEKYDVTVEAIHEKLASYLAKGA